MGKRTQKLMLKDLAKKTLYLGYVGENVHTQIIIDCSEVFWDYPDAVPRLNVTPPRGDRYPATQLVKDGDDLIWTITNSDIIYSGSGHVQLQFVDGDEVIKTAVGTTKIDGSIETTGEAPTPLEDWMNQAEDTAHQIALTAKDEVIEQIQDAAEAARESIPEDYTQLSDDVSSLKSAITDIDDALFDVSKNVYDPDTEWINGKFSNGVIVPLETGKNNAATTDYIPVTHNADWVISWKAVDLNCTMYVDAYKSDHTWLQIIKSISMNSVSRYGTFTTPDTCAFIRLSIYRSGADWQTIIPTEIQVELGTTPTEYQPKSKTSKFVDVYEEMDDLQNQINDNPALTQRRKVGSDINLLANPIPGYLTNDGNFNTTTHGWYHSDYVPVEPGMFVYFYNINPWNYYGFFNASKTWIGGKNIETPVGTNGNMLMTHQVPAGAAYMMVSFEDTRAATCWGNYTPTIPIGELIYANKNTLRAYTDFPDNPCDYSGMDICTFRKGLCIGDSLTAGGFNYNSGTNPWSDGNVYSYPSQLEKMTGIPITNKGDSGVTSVVWWQTYGTGGTDPMDFSGYDFAVIHLGVNDVSYNVSTADTQAALENIINALKTANTGIKIFLCTIIPAYATAISTNYDTINTLIKSLADTNVYILDLTTYSHLWINSEYAAGHLTAYGYWRMAKDIMAYIGYTMRKYPSEFRFIQFIGTDMTY